MIACALGVLNVLTAYFGCSSSSLRKAMQVHVRFVSVFNRCVVRVCVVIVSLSSVIVFPKESNASSCSLRVFLIRCVVRVCVVIVSLSSVIAVSFRAL